MVEKYVEDGTLRLEWRDFPYQGQESVNAALAARAAQAQDKFWEYNELLYENQDRGFGDEQLLGYAREANLDVERFRADLLNSAYAEAVSQDFQEGQQLGISGTPAFVVNGQMIVGLQPMETFEQVIEDARREAEGG